MPAAPLVDICNLSLHIRNLNDDLIPAVVFLLGGMPNLNTLHIKCTFSSGLANYLVSDLTVLPLDLPLLHTYALTAFANCPSR